MLVRMILDIKQWSAFLWKNSNVYSLYFFAFYWLLVFWAAVGRPDPRPFLHHPHHRVVASR